MSETPPFDLIADAARGYHELLYRIDTTCSISLCERDWDETNAEEIVDKYLREIADPWRAEVERLAAEDGIGVRTFTAGDGTSLSFGFLEATVANLLLPDSERHPHAGPRNLLCHGRAIDETWFDAFGPELTAARERSCERTGSGGAPRLHRVPRPDARSCDETAAVCSVQGRGAFRCATP